MKDLEIIFNRESIYISTEFMSTIFIGYNYGEYFIEAGRTDFSTNKLGVSHQWINSKLKDGDHLTINVLKKDDLTSRQPKTIVNQKNDLMPENSDEFNLRLLSKFKTIEKLLKKEGVLK